MYELYYYPSNASMAPHFVLEDIGVPFRLNYVDREQNAHKSAAYLKLNPLGLIPVLVDGDTVLSETAAICLYLSDNHPEAQLAPSVGTPERGYFYKWLLYLANTIHAEMMAYYYPERYTNDPHGADGVKSAVEGRIIAMFATVDDHLSHAGPYLMGAQYTLVDGYLLMLARWARHMKTPPRQMTHVARTLDLVAARPAVQRALKTEGLASPIY